MPLGLLVAFALLCGPQWALAAVSIHEVMYDLPGTDSGREWVELHNDGSASIDLAGWKLFEANVNHALATSSGQNFLLPAGGFAVVADDPAKFLADWPAFSGILFNSSFSLSNTGETLVLRDADLADIDSATYDSSAGAAGDGQSLHRAGTNFVAAPPTPGANGAAGAEEPPEEGAAEEETPPPAPEPAGGGGGSVSFPVEPQIFADAGKDRTVIVGADSVFEGRAWGLKREPLEGARFIWNFGNGVVKEGQRTLARYDYPGTYAVALSVASGKYSASDYLTVTALAADIIISYADASRIELSNRTNRDLDLSFWLIAANGARFMLPEHTIILANKKLPLASAVTKLAPASVAEAALLYPNGAPALAVEPSTIQNVAVPPPRPSAAAAPPREAPQAPKTVPFAQAQAAAAASAAGAETPAAATRPLAPYLAALSLIIAAGIAALFLWKREEDGEIKILE